MEYQRMSAIAPRQTTDKLSARVCLAMAESGLKRLQPAEHVRVTFWDLKRDRDLDPCIRRPDWFRERESVLQREEDLARKREVNSLVARWHALRKAKRPRSYIKSENE